MPKKQPISQKKLKVVITGGGTGGHVIPALAVADELLRHGNVQIDYVGSKNSIEEDLAREKKLNFHAVTVGKLRRYLSFKNLVDVVRVPAGVAQAILLLRRLKPDVVFAKGGYVSVPVAVAAGVLRIPLVIHESDVTPGLATKIASRFARTICTSFDETKKYLPGKNAVVTGNPTRRPGSAARGRSFLKFKKRRPIVLVTGGSTGAGFLNDLVRDTATDILRVANIVWLTGGKAPKLSRGHLRQYNFLGAEYPDVLAAADLVISRAGANSLFELAMAGKPAILIPLPLAGSRGDQILNGRYFARKKAAVSYEQEHIRPQSFARDVVSWIGDKKKLKTFGTEIQKLAPKNAVKDIAKVILQACKN